MANRISADEYKKIGFPSKTDALAFISKKKIKKSSSVTEKEFLKDLKKKRIEAEKPVKAEKARVRKQKEKEVKELREKGLTKPRGRPKKVRTYEEVKQRVKEIEDEEKGRVKNIPEIPAPVKPEPKIIQEPPKPPPEDDLESEDDLEPEDVREEQNKGPTFEEKIEQIESLNKQMMDLFEGEISSFNTLPRNRFTINEVVLSNQPFTTMAELYDIFSRVRASRDLVFNNGEMLNSVKVYIPSGKRTNPSGRIVGNNSFDRIIQINSSLMDSYEDFMNYLKEDLTTIGSDGIEFEWTGEDLMLSRFDLIYQKYDINGGKMNQDLFNTVDLNEEEGYKIGECVLNTFRYLGYELTESDITDIDLAHVKEQDMIKLCRMFNITLYANKLSGGRLESIFKSVNDEGYMSLAKREKYYFKNGNRLTPFFGREYIGDINKILDVLNHGNTNKIIVYSNGHIEPFESVNRVIFCTNGLDVFTIKNDTVVRITQRKSNENNIINHKKEKLDRIYSFFDYEAALDLNTPGLPFKEYSLGYWTISESDLNKLVSSLKKNCNQDELLLRLKKSKQCNCFVGEDCTKMYLEYLRKLPNSSVVLVGFNNSNFDNFFILRELERSYADDKNEFDYDVFYNKNSIINIKFFNRIEVFDLAKHLTNGSLRYYCESFKVQASKVDFDHSIAQDRYNNGTLYEKEFMEEFIRYNLFDSVSTGLLFHAYNSTINDIVFFRSPKKDHKLIHIGDKDLIQYKTIGGLMWNVMLKYWEELEIKVPKFKVPELFKSGDDYLKALDNISKYKKVEKYVKVGNCQCGICKNKAMKARKPKIEKRKEELAEPEKYLNVEALKDFDNYNSIRAYLSAGRCDLPDDIPHIIHGELVSLDACSMYPYVMAVKECWYPYGEMIEVEEDEEFDTEAFGYYWCTVDQSNLAPEKKILCEKTCTSNVWNTKNILCDYFINSEKIKLLQSRGCDVKMRHGIKFTEMIRSCDLFRPLLSLMKLKNEQDKYKSSKSDKYNGAMREILKLMINSVSGKVIEKLHTEKIRYIKQSEYDKLFLGRSERGDVLREVSIINGTNTHYLVQYKTSLLEEFEDHRPLFYADFIYTYAQRHLYENLIELGALYRDTDSGKFTKVSAEDCIKELKTRPLSHWPDVEAYDERMKGAMLYNDDFKCFGTFENEISDMGNMIISFFNKKKEYLMKSDKCIKMKGKGIKDTDLPLRKEMFIELGLTVDDLCDWDENKIRKALEKKVTENQYHELYEKYRINDKKIKRDWEKVFTDLVMKKKGVFLLTSQFKRVVNNTKRNVTPEDTDNMNKNANTIRMSYVVKYISPNSNDYAVYHELDINMNSYFD